MTRWGPRLGEEWRRYGSFVSLALLGAWTILQFRTTVLRVPAPLLWLSVLGAFLAGHTFVALRRDRLDVPRVIPAVLLAAVLAGGAFTFGELALSPSRSHLVAVVVWIVSLLAGWVTATQASKGNIGRSGLVFGVLAAWAIGDAYATRGFGLYDLHVYLGGGARFLDGRNPYLTAPLTALPSSASSDAFLYPPSFLPVFGALSQLPFAVVAVGWVVLLFGSALLALRLMGLPWALAVVFLFFPPLLKGVDSGNVANVVLLLFVAGPYAGAALALGGLFKVQGGIGSLWLLRERMWRQLIIGGVWLGGAVLLSLVTLGASVWGDWLRGLAYREESQRNLPILYGNSLAQYMPVAAFVALSVLAVGLSLIPNGRRGLAALGLATVVATPSLWPHGFLTALPALLYLPMPMFWLAVGIGSVGASRWWLVVFGVVGILGSFRRGVRVGTDSLLGGGPWRSSLADRVARRGADR